MCATDIFTLEEVDYLVVGNFYSKIIFVQHLPPGQTNTNKFISLLKEIFSEHGIPEVLCSGNGPQYVSAQFANICLSWGIKHKTSSPHYPQSNRFAKACIKSIKHALQWAKYSSANPQLTLLTLWATSINTKLPSPAEILYQCRLRTNIPAKICNNDPSAIQVCEQIDTHSEAAKSQVDKCSKTLAPLHAGQPVAMYDTLCKIWIPATVVHVLPKDSYQVFTSDGVVYHCMRWHLHECSVKPTDTTLDITSAIPQAPAIPCISATLPAPAKLPLLPQPPPVAPTTPVTTKPQTPAVPEVTPVPAPMSATPSIAPVQPHRLGHACTAPKHLIQEM